MNKLVIAMVLASSVILGGCSTTSPEDLATWQQSSAILREELTALEIELLQVSDPIERASLQAKVAEMKRVADIFDTAIQSATDSADAPFAFMETALLVAGGFFPPALLGLPIIRTLRRQRTAIFTAVAAGGGPNNPNLAKASLKSNPGAMTAFAKWKANGA